MSVTCQLCPARFDVVVALDFHVRREHPGAAELYRSVLRDLYRTERNAKRAAYLPTGRLPPALDGLYRAGCPCGRSYTAHLALHRAEVTPSDRDQQPPGASPGPDLPQTGERCQHGE
jgi:hypothetical protein